MQMHTSFLRFVYIVGVGFETASLSEAAQQEALLLEEIRDDPRLETEVQEEEKPGRRRRLQLLSKKKKKKKRSTSFIECLTEESTPLI